MSLLCCFGPLQSGHKQYIGPKSSSWREDELGPISRKPPAEVQASAAVWQQTSSSIEPVSISQDKTVTSACNTSSFKQAGHLESSLDHTTATSFAVTGGTASPSGHTPAGTGDLSISGDPLNSLPVISPLSPVVLFQELGNLTYLGQGACGVVYLGASASLGGLEVAVKFMVCTTPRQLWQRAKEALLSKLVSHPNLVHTSSMDVSEVTERTYVEWARFTLPDAAHGSTQTGALGPSPRRLSTQAQNQPALSSTQGSNSMGSQQQTAAISADAESNSSTQQTGRPAAYTHVSMLETSNDVETSTSSPAVSPGRGQAGSESPVPFRDVLYHLDATPGRFMAMVTMEYCDQGTLVQATSRGDFQCSDPGNPYTLRRLQALIQTALEVATAMQHLHSLSIIHGDLKPGNVLLRSCQPPLRGSSSSGGGSLQAAGCTLSAAAAEHALHAMDEDQGRGYTCKVSDFGLATTIETTEQTITGENWGTLAYMAPEVVSGRCRKASDVYSFGVLLWGLVTGQQPYAGLQAGQVLLGVKSGTLSLEWPAWAHTGIVKVGQACLRFDPKDRPGFKGVTSALHKIALKLHAQRHAAHTAAMQNPQQEQQ